MKYLALLFLPFLAFGQITVHTIASYPDSAAPYDSMQFVAQPKPTQIGLTYRKIYGVQLRNWVNAQFDSAGCSGLIDCDSTGTGKLVRQTGPTLTGATLNGTTTAGPINASDWTNYTTTNTGIRITDSTHDLQIGDYSYSSRIAILGNNYGSSLDGFIFYNAGNVAGSTHSFYAGGSGGTHSFDIRSDTNVSFVPLTVHGPISLTSGGSNNGYVCYTASTHAFSVSDTTCPHP